jgi:tetratricopeptide (TPR) repeat protein
MRGAIRASRAGTDVTERDRLLNEAEKLAGQARGFAESAKDRGALLEAIYSLGRASEIRREFDRALDLYREGLGYGTTDGEKGRFNAAVSRVRIDRLLKTGPAAEKRTGGRPPIATLPAIGPSSTLLLVAIQSGAGSEVDLEQAIEEAEMAVRQSPIPVAYFALGKARNALARHEKLGHHDDRARQQVARAIQALRLGIEGLLSARTSGESMDDLQGTLGEVLFGEYDGAHRLQMDLAERKMTRDFQAVRQSLAAENARWHALADQIAVLIDKPRPRGSDPAEPWMDSVVQHVTRSDELVKRQAGQTEHYRQMERLWAEFAVRIARTVGYPIDSIADPGQSQRIAEKARTWMTGMERVIAGLVSQRASNQSLATPGADPDASGGRHDDWVGYYNMGLDQLFAHQYGDAIQSLNRSIALHHRDARPYYFRAVARYYACAGSPERLDEAVEDLRRAAALEREGSPGPREVSLALVRVQFAPRNWLEGYRGSYTRSLIPALPR